MADKAPGQRGVGCAPSERSRSIRSEGTEAASGQLTAVHDWRKAERLLTGARTKDSLEVAKHKIYTKLKERYDEKTDVKRRHPKSATGGSSKSDISKPYSRPSSSGSSKAVHRRLSNRSERAPIGRLKTIDESEAFDQFGKGAPSQRPMDTQTKRIVPLPTCKQQMPTPTNRSNKSTKKSDLGCMIDVSTRTLSPQKLEDLCSQRDPVPPDICCQAPTAGPSGQRCLIERPGTSKKGNQDCDQPGRQIKKTVIFGPLHLPVTPGMYEAPYRQLPGPKEIILRDGDINPNDTTVIDITCLSPQDPVDIGIPRYPIDIEIDPQSPTSPPPPHPGNEEGRKMLNEKRREKFRKKPFAPILPSQRREEARKRKEKEKTYVCQRIKGYSGKRNVEYRDNPLTNEELRELEEHKKNIREQLEKELRQREREQRGLGHDDLLDIDANDVEMIPVSECKTASPDPWDRIAPFERYEECSSVEMRDPLDFMTPETPSPQSRPREVTLWDSHWPRESLPQIEEMDLMTQSPVGSCAKEECNPSKMNLLYLDPPDVDLLGLRSPRKSKKEPAKCTLQSPRDMFKFDTPVAEPLPFDVCPDPCDVDFIYRKSPEAKGLPSPMKTIRNPSPAQNPWSCAGMTSGPSSASSPFEQFENMTPCRPNIRKVKAVINPADPTSAILETSLDTYRRSPRELTPTRMDQSDISSSNESLGLLKDEDWNEEGLLDKRWESRRAEGFNRLVRRRLFGDSDPCLSTPMDEDDDNDLDIIDIPDVGDIVSPDHEFSIGAQMNTRRDVLDFNRNILDEDCPFPEGLDDIDIDFGEGSSSDLLELCNNRSTSQNPCPEAFGPHARELMDMVDSDLTKCDDLLGMFTPTDPTEDTQMNQFGTYTQELINEIKEEDNLIDMECCEDDPSPSSYQFGYSADLFTNIEWDPEMKERYEEIWGRPKSDDQ